MSKWDAFRYVVFIVISGFFQKLFERDKKRVGVELKIEQTHRGFDFAKFDDLYGDHCSIQKSSLAFQDAIWLGVDTTPDGLELGPTDPISGRHIGARMHLTQEMVAALLPLLQKFVETGEIS